MGVRRGVYAGLLSSESAERVERGAGAEEVLERADGVLERSEGAGEAAAMGFDFHVCPPAVYLSLA